MQPGSLVVPTIDYIETAKLGIIFSPFAPNPNTICTVKAISPATDSLGRMSAGLHLEEVTVSDPTGKNPYLSFAPEYWREIQAPGEINIEELIEESCCVPVER